MRRGDTGDDTGLWYRVTHKDRGIWKTCVGFPEWEVSDQGMVRRSADGGLVAVRVSNYSNKRQYRSVRYLKDGNQYSSSLAVSHLVLEAFGRIRPSPRHVAHHINGVLTDDRLENLEWLTRAESARHSTEARYGVKRAVQVRGRAGQKNASDAVVRKICADILAEVDTHEQIAKRHGVSKQFVTQVANGHQRVAIAWSEGLLNDHPAVVRYAWPKLEIQDRKKIMAIVRAALDRE